MPRNRGWGIAVFVLGILSTIQTLIVNTIGFADADTGSAFACGHQWLTCNGQIIPSLTNWRTLIEYSHRINVPILTVLLLATAIIASWRYRKWPEIPILSGISIFFVILEAVLGAIAVVWNEPPAVIATHFGVSLLAFSSVLLLTINVWRIERVWEASLVSGVPLPIRKPLPNRSYRWWAWLSGPYIYIAMYVGAYISSASVGGLFRGIPIPTESASAPHHALLLDWTHRSLAGILVLWVLVLFVLAVQMRNERRDLFIGSIFALSFVVLQAFSGFYLVASHVSLPAFLTHVTVVTGLFGSLCFIAMQTLPPSSGRHVEDSPSLGTGAGSKA
ncbi:COX15/CtaA family protein [Alicyclobacillus fastidiosus]|uniref:COX15/CtaA family protein n=1 Tax=Alicyclobacillus fastidiosus TaxID=392011 RepID=A0ABY6ZF61_9BACL|nr:COX15/CtaA family protein [Alicyclobacillus fastidiosus]WAH41539.1 COX15/CtaA family protein [Alicyclobacillus fastidiosus]GMA63193.1 heme A synthase [Alicyclobacillus fastidiosus]